MGIKNGMRRDVLARRDTRLDIIRFLAILLLLPLHFLLFTGYYERPADSMQMFLLTVLRVISNICVPLFLLLTGSLMYQKTLSKAYYRGIVKTLSVYVLASVVCIAYKACYLDASYTLATAAAEILSFQAAPYAWYVNLYIGLFLLIPFLNLAYHGLQTPEKKRVLIWTLALLAVAPSLLNSFDLKTPGWWANPASSDDYTRLVPDYWLSAWPVFYYFLGAYLREYGVRMNRLVNGGLIVLSVLLFGAYNYYRVQPGLPNTVFWNEEYGFENVVVASLVFLFCLRLNANGWPRGVRLLFYAVSERSFGMYLTSYVFEHFFYAQLNAAIAPMDRASWLPVAILLIFVGSFLASAALDAVYRGLAFACGRIARSISGRHTR